MVLRYLYLEGICRKNKKDLIKKIEDVFTEPSKRECENERS